MAKRQDVYFTQQPKTPPLAKMNLNIRCAPLISTLVSRWFGVATQFCCLTFFIYPQACGKGRGCAKAKVSLRIPCDYFGRTPEEIDYLLYRKVNADLKDSIDSTRDALLALKEMNSHYTPYGMALKTKLVQWNRAIKAFCKKHISDMTKLQIAISRKLDTVLGPIRPREPKLEKEGKPTKETSQRTEVYTHKSRPNIK